MAKVIVYQREDGKNIVLWPTGETSVLLTAEKDVPKDRPYLIVSAASIPSDRAMRDAMTLDFSSPDGVGADYGSGSVNDVVAYNVDGDPIVLLKQESELAGADVLRTFPIQKD